jgi:hypothetical protein
MALKLATPGGCALRLHSDIDHTKLVDVQVSYADSWQWCHVTLSIVRLMKMTELTDCPMRCRVYIVPSPTMKA